MSKINSDKFSMLEIANLIDSWKQQYHTDSRHNIIFQFKALFANVRLSPNFIHSAHLFNRGFVNIPEAVKSPDEVWSHWLDAKTQKVVISNYILTDTDINYVVTTEGSMIKKAMIVVPSRIDRYRKGVITYKS